MLSLPWMRSAVPRRRTSCSKDRDDGGVPPAYLSALAGAVLVLVVVRIVATPPPSGRGARPIGRVDALLVLIGLVGLLFHCLAMFARPFAQGVPGAAALVSPINGLGPASVLLYALPAALVLLGLRRQWRPVPGAVLLVLLAVGVTMYDGGPVQIHLAAIFTAVVVLAAALLLFVRTEPPGGRGVRPSRA